MEPKRYLNKLAQAVSKRSGISANTCMVVLPAIFDEIRQTLCEGKYRCVTIESFGTFIVRQIPQRHYTRRMPDGTTRLVDLPPKLKVAFSPTRNMRCEVEESTFNPTRQSFHLHPDDRGIRIRKSIPDPTKRKKPIVGDSMEGTVVRERHTDPADRYKIKILRGKGE